MGARRFDHALLYGPEIEKVLDFFTKVLDFRCAERVDMPDGLLAIWLTCGMKAHDIAFVKHPEPGKLHHVSFDLENWQSVGHAADIITRYDISIDIGPTRHGITRGQTIYFFDPSGNRNEVFAGGYTYYPDNPTRTWDETQIGKGIFYYERQLNEAFLSRRDLNGNCAPCRSPSHFRPSTSAAALAAVQAAVAHGGAIGKSVVAAVVDASGDLMACLRADGAFKPSIGIAQDKAYTAAVFGAATDALSQALERKRDFASGHRPAARRGSVRWRAADRCRRRRSSAASAFPAVRKTTTGPARRAGLPPRIE